MQEVKALPGLADGVEQIGRTLSSGHVPPTWLIHGPEGTGKWALAMELAAALLCIEPSPWACGSCASCRRTSAFGNSDLYLLFPFPTGGGTGKARAKFQEEFTSAFIELKRTEPLLPFPERRNRFIPAERITELLNWTRLKPSAGRRKVVLIYEPELIVRTVIDKLLKLTEEPPVDTTILLVSHRPEGLPDTIRSRARQLHVKRMGPSTLQNYLVSTGYPESAAALAARQARGAVGPALERLSSRDETDPQAEALGLLTGLIELKSGALFGAQMMQWKAERQKATDLLDIWAVLVRDIALGSTADPLLGTPDPAHARLLAGLADPDRAASALDLIRETQSALATNVHIAVALVALARRIAALGRQEEPAARFWPRLQRV